MQADLTYARTEVVRKAQRIRMLKSALALAEVSLIESLDEIDNNASRLSVLVAHEVAEVPRKPGRAKRAIRRMKAPRPKSAK